MKVVGETNKTVVFFGGGFVWVGDFLLKIKIRKRLGLRCFWWVKFLQ